MKEGFDMKIKGKIKKIGLGLGTVGTMVVLKANSVLISSWKRNI